MGFINDAVKSVDKSDEKFNETSEALNLLVELSKSKAEIYLEEIKDNLNRGRLLSGGESTDSLYFPISSIKEQRQQYRCITQNTVQTEIMDKISEAITDMIDAPSGKGIITGIAKIINTGLEAILGVSKGEEQLCKSTSTFIEGNGVAVNIVRFDCIIWARAVQSESIRKKVQTALACVACKSVVNVTKLSFDDFRSVYAPVLEASGEKNSLEAIKKAREIYDLLGGGSNCNFKLSQEGGLELSQSDLIYIS